MKIVVIGHVRFPIRAPFKGGMEAHTHALVRELQRRGHEVTLLASGDSDPGLPIHAVTERHYEAEMPWAEWHSRPEFRARQREIFERGWQVVLERRPDVVHNNSLFFDLPRWAARDDVPMLTSLHVPPFKLLEDAIADVRDRPQLRFSTVSHSQLSQWAPGGHPHFAAIPNGIDTDVWRARGAVGSHAIWAGRITPNKGTGDAVAAARRAGWRLDLYGPIEDRAYFDRHVRPMLSPAVRYRGNVRPERLQREMARARVALITPCWDEPFGLVAAEALACGTPIAGYARGAIPEVTGDCGALVEEGDVEGLARALERAARIDPARCRARAMGFTQGAMVEGYERLYSAATGSRASASSCSSTKYELA